MSKGTLYINIIAENTMTLLHSGKVSATATKTSPWECLFDKLHSILEVNGR